MYHNGFDGFDYLNTWLRSKENEIFDQIDQRIAFLTFINH
jgi:hypothetical protein